MSDGKPTDSQGPPRETNPWTRPWFIASAAATVLIAALGVVYLMIPSRGQSSAAAAAAATAATATASSTGTAGAQDSACGLPTGDQRYPSVGFSSKWVLLGRIAVPTDPKGAGPGKVEGNVRTCYQHSPTGALYAAANAAAGAFLPDGGMTVVKYLAAKGPRRDQFLESPPPSSAPDTTTGVQIGGFQLQSYSPYAATIVIGLKTSTGGFGSLTMPLKWEDGDWKVDYDSTGNVTKLGDLSSFVPWSGA